MVKLLDLATEFCQGEVPGTAIGPNSSTTLQSEGCMAKKILIVEDEKLIGLMLAENVKDLGCQVTKVVSSGQAALRAVQLDPPDAILMDISLDGAMSGIETARQIKSTRDIPILFFTGYQDPHLLSQADAVKPVGIVDKLDTTENIQQAICALLQ